MLSDVLGSVDFGKSTYSSPKWSLACEQRVGRPNPYEKTDGFSIPRRHYNLFSDQVRNA